jgi:hypothetical protein
MKWLLDDPVVGKQTAWWSIDPQTGEPTDVTIPSGVVCDCLGESVLADVGMVATNIEVTFGASRCFSDDETKGLLLDRHVPASVQSYPDATAELLESVDDLWRLVEERYRQAWGRSATEVERRWLCCRAVGMLRPRKN